MKMEFTQDQARFLATLMDNNSSAGQWDGGDVCEALAQVIKAYGGWETCAEEHGLYSASNTSCPWCVQHDTLTIELAGTAQGPWTAALSDPIEPYGTPFGEGVGQTARDAVLDLIDKIALPGE